MSIEPQTLFAVIDQNTAVQSLLGIVVGLILTFISRVSSRIDAIPTREEYDTKMTAIANETMHQEEILKEHKADTKVMFRDLKQQLLTSDNKLATSLDKVQSKLEEVLVKLPK